MQQNTLKFQKDSQRRCFSGRVRVRKVAMSRLKFILLWLLLSTAIMTWWMRGNRAFHAATDLSPQMSASIQPSGIGDADTFPGDLQDASIANRKVPDLIWLRRLCLALTGTIPSVEWIRDFESWPEEMRVSNALQRIFEDPRYGDYMAERFARAFVGVESGPFLVFRRRRMVDDLSESIQSNQPYDQVIREMITAHGVWTSNPEVNFLTATIDPNNDQEGPDEVKLAARVSRAFLGVRIDCVQCHDDMFGDRWKQRDFHQLASFFAGAEMSLTGLVESEKQYEYRYKRRAETEVVPPVVPFLQNLLPQEGSLRERLAAWVTHPENLPFARTLVNRVWAIMFNRPMVEPVDSIPLDGPVPERMDDLANETVEHGFDLQHLIRTIAMTEEFCRSSRGSSGEEDKLFPLTRLRPEQVAGSIIQSASLETVDVDSHIFSRIIRVLQQGEFIKRYGDAGEAEFEAKSGTIPQRLTLMNGKLVHERTEKNPIMNAATRIGFLAADDGTAVETAYLAVLTRRPTSEEMDHFKDRLSGTKKDARANAMQDLYWALLNSTEFAWNH